ncbi:MFS transporter [Kineococcus sp. LSe6-4]|uniref:MFS transporter n=1 Tax=Kineococcus halophytocola TaxID=3234027 RepID=A0ABV4H5V2_9ACTN
MSTDRPSQPSAATIDPRTPAAPHDGVVPGRWRKLASISAPLFADNNEVSVLSTLAPVIIAALALPLTAIGLLVSVAKGISIVCGPVWALIARRTNRKTAFVVASLLTGVFTAATGLSQNFTQLVLLWSLTAVFVAAALPITSEITSPLIGQLARVEDGWRYGFFVWGGLTVVAALIMAFTFKDPGIGASEPATGLMSAEQRAQNAKLTWAKVRELLTIPTFVLMLGQRVLSGHLLIATFGVVFLVNTYGFTTAVAAVVTLPFGLAYLGGTILGGMGVDALHQRRPGSGRVMVLQGAQLGFGAVAILATQVDWGSIGVFAVFWGLMGFMQGLNPGVNRPIVAAVVPPELRGAAFALMLSVFEALGYIVFNLLASYLGEQIGLKAVMLWIPGVLMLLNGLYCALLYRTYPRDTARLTELMAQRARS